LTFLLRCNSDVTSLLSGNCNQGIVAYISDYVTRAWFEDLHYLDTIKVCLIRVLKCWVVRRRGKTRPEVSYENRQCSYGQTEIGGPMAPYLLGNLIITPISVSLYSTGKAMLQRFWSLEADDDVTVDKVVLLKNVDGEYIGLSMVDDYMYKAYKLNENPWYDGFRYPQDWTQ